MVFYDQSIPIIKSNWVLRNDKKYIILYKLSFTENEHIVLPVVIATLIPLINGKNNKKKIIESIQYIYDLTLVESENIFKKFIFFLNNHDEIIIDSNLDNYHSNVFSTEEFITDYANYDHKIRRLELPYTISLSITNRCSTNCIYCYAERKYFDNQSKLSVNRWNNIIDEIKDLKILCVELSGADPLTTQNSRNIVFSLIEKGLIFLLSTKNYIDEDLSKKLIDLGFNNQVRGVNRKIQISIDSVSNVEASFLTNTKNYFKRADESIKNLMKSGIRPIVKSVLTPFNYKSFPATLDYFLSIGIEEFQFVHYSKSPYYFREDLFLSKEQKIWLREQYEYMLAKITPQKELSFQSDIDDFDPLKRMSIPDWKKRNYCSGGRTTFCIHPNGDISLCEQMPHIPEYTFGNVKKHSISEAWKDPRINDFLFASRDKFKGTVCNECHDFDECQSDKGYCYREALFNYGSVWDAPPDCPYQTKPALRQI